MMPKKTVKLGGDILDITDPVNVPPVSADLISEIRIYAGNVVCLSFAAIIADGDAKPEARITARLRLTLPGAMDLRNALEELFKEAMPGKARSN